MGRNGYVLALGVSGYSHSHRYVYQNTVNTKSYIERLHANQLPIEKMYELSPEESLRRHMVLVMKHTKLDLSEVAKMNPECADLLAGFEPIFEALALKELIARKGSLLEYTPAGVSLADKYARLFYSKSVNEKLMAIDFDSLKKNDSFNFTV